MKVNGNTIKPGNVIEHKNGLWVATKTSHVKPGKGGAFAQIELKNLKDGSKLNERFRSSENVEKVILVLGMLQPSIARCARKLEKRLDGLIVDQEINVLINKEDGEKRILNTSKVIWKSGEVIIRKKLTQQNANG